MAQSRTEPTPPSAFELTQRLNDHLSKIEKAFSNAFQAAGYDGLFNDFWGMVSPVYFPCDDLAAINKYYNDQPKRIPYILETRQLQNLPLDKQLILKAISGLCHSLSRIKYIVGKLTVSLPKPGTVSDDCRYLHEQINAVNLRSNGGILKSNHNKLLSLDNQCQYVSAKLSSLGYLTNEVVISTQSSHCLDLPEHLIRQLLKLKNNNELNELIEPIEMAKKAGRDITEPSRSLIEEINIMRESQHQLTHHFDSIIAKLADDLAQLESDKQQLGQTLSTIDGITYVLQLTTLLTELEDQRCCLSLSAAIANLTNFCEKSRSLFSTSTLGIVSDPWQEAKNAVQGLLALSNQSNAYFSSYLPNGVDILRLNHQYKQLKEQFNMLCASSSELHNIINSKKLTVGGYHHALEETIKLLEDHLRPVKSDSMFGFIGRHWDKMAAGSAIGGSAAVAAVLISTNPILLTVCIASGIAMGAAGGTGGGLIQDAVTERKHKLDTRSAANTKAKSYGSFWRTESSAAAAADLTTDVALRK